MSTPFCFIFPHVHDFFSLIFHSHWTCHNTSNTYIPQMNSTLEQLEIDYNCWYYSLCKKKKKKKKVKRIEGKTARKTIENNHWHLEIKIIVLNRKQELCYWKKKNKNGGWAIFKEKRMRNHKPKAKRVWNLISSETLFVT